MFLVPDDDATTDRASAIVPHGCDSEPHEPPEPPEATKTPAVVLGLVSRQAGAEPPALHAV